jgi:hypothetical protein
MKRSMGVKTNIVILIILIVLLISTLVYNLLMPQNIISYALLGIVVLLAIFTLKKINQKL